jgi:cytoplasmic FMR1 interacting protein
MLYGSKALRDAYSSVVKLYEHFVGAIHFRVMSRLLGYQGIAMILEQMLNITEAQVGSWGGEGGGEGRGGEGRGGGF